MRTVSLIAVLIVSFVAGVLACSERNTCYQCLYQMPRSCVWCGHCTNETNVQCLASLPSNFTIAKPICEVASDIRALVPPTAGVIFLLTLFCFGLAYRMWDPERIRYINNPKCESCDHTHHTSVCVAKFAVPGRECPKCKHPCHAAHKNCDTKVTHTTITHVTREVEEKERVGTKTVKKTVNVPRTVTKQRPVQRSRLVNKSVVCSEYPNYYQTNDYFPIFKSVTVPELYNDVETYQDTEFRSEVIDTQEPEFRVYKVKKNFDEPSYTEKACGCKKCKCTNCVRKKCGCVKCTCAKCKSRPWFGTIMLITLGLSPAIGFLCHIVSYGLYSEWKLFAMTLNKYTSATEHSLVAAEILQWIAVGFFSAPIIIAPILILLKCCCSRKENTQYISV